MLKIDRDHNSNDGGLKIIVSESGMGRGYSVFVKDAHEAGLAVAHYYGGAHHYNSPKRGCPFCRRQAEQNRKTALSRSRGRFTQKWRIHNGQSKHGEYRRDVEMVHSQCRGNMGGWDGLDWIAQVSGLRRWRRYNQARISAH